jgi:hypothetical protein
VLASLFKGYKKPNEKIHDLLVNGTLVSLKRGLYMIGPSFNVSQPPGELVANHLMGPSYISLDYALAIHRLIPEQVFEISSMTTKASKEYDTPLGKFTFTHLPLPYYSFGITTEVLSADQHYLLASPAKALCDKIITTPKCNFRSKKEVTDFLTSDLRIEKESWNKIDLFAIQNWLHCAPKKNSLSLLVKTMQSQ